MRCSVRQRSVPALSSESSCLDARMDDGDAGDSDVLAVCFRGAVREITLEDVADRSARCASAPLLVVAIVGGAGVFVTA